MRGFSLTFLYCLGLTAICYSQTPYYEDFSTTNGEGVEGTTGGIGNPIVPFNACNSQWFINGDGTGLTAATDYLQVTGGLLEAVDLDSELCFSTTTIDVSGINSLDFDLLVNEMGTHEATDYVDVSYIIDGASTTIFNYQGNGNASHTLIDDFTTATVSLDNIDISTANSFAIEICLLNNAGTEQLQIDNIAIYESGTTAPTSGTPSCPITTEVQFVSTTSTIAEDGGTIDVCIEITNPDATNATAVEVALEVAGTATEGIGNDFTAIPSLMATLTFPAGSGASECISFTIEDDAIFEGDEQIILNLENPTGGLSVSLGNNSTHTLTINDNEAAACTYNSGGIFITELSYNPCSAQGSDSACEYVEIYNAYSNAVDLSSWEMTGFNYIFPASTMIASGNYLVLGISNDDCVDYNLAGLAVATSGLVNSGETLNIIDDCGIIISSLTYDNTFANGDCNAVAIDPMGNFSAVTPNPGTGSCMPSTDSYIAPCGILALGLPEVDCLNYTGAADPVKVSIPYTGIDQCALITNNAAGTIGGDDINSVVDGIIEIMLNEGETWGIEISGSNCSGLTSIGTVSAAECTTSCGVTTSIETATINFNTTTSAAVVNTLDDTFVNNEELGFCGSDEFDMVYGTLDWAAGQGTITGLVSTDGTNLGTPYTGAVTFELSEVLQSCAGTGNTGFTIPGTSSNNIISINQNSLQGTSVKPSNIGPHFTESDGSFQGINMACINFSLPIMKVSFWIGDVETSAVNPGYIHLYDAAGDLISSNPIPTETPVVDQATNCVGSTGGSGYSGCGNNETVFIDINSPDGISEICIEVGDFSDDNSDPGGTEHISFGGVSLGGVCVDRDPIPTCTNLLAYQEFDGTVASWTYIASPTSYSEETDSDIWQPRTDPTGGTGTVSATGVDNNFFWGIRDINNGGSGGTIEHTLTFEFDITCYEDVSISFDYIANLFETADNLSYQIQDENGADVVAKQNLPKTGTWMTSTSTIPNTVKAITLTLYADQNGDADSGGFDKVYICGTSIAAAPLSFSLDGACIDNSGIITMDLAGGVPPYEVSGDFSSNIEIGGNGIIIATGLPEETYTVTVVDNCGNEETQMVTVTPSCALPIELFDFRAIQINKEVLIKWSTASETNNDYFVVEHSLDESTFHEIGRVNGKGNSTVIQTYQHLHPTPVAGNNYYRLMQVDLGGVVSYSDLISLFIKKDIVLEIYPNPARELLTIAFGNEGVSNGVVQLMSVEGKVIRNIVLENDQTRLDINIVDFPSGIYFVEFTSDRLNEVRKIVVE